MKKTCPSCGRTFEELANYCGTCGGKLERELNRCSEERNALCRSKTFPDREKYCIYCGALTTYAKAVQDGEW